VWHKFSAHFVPTDPTVVRSATLPVTSSQFVRITVSLPNVQRSSADATVTVRPPH
jgi:hypothetical protein